MNFAFGLHPRKARCVTDGVLSRLRQLLRSPDAVAVGEIGIDYSEGSPPFDIQKAALDAVLPLAIQTGLPLVIHCRGNGADADCIRILEASRLTADTRIHRHCFEGSSSVVDLWLQAFHNTCFGVTGSILGKSSPRVASLLQRLLDASKLLLETDSPDMRPRAPRGSFNSPYTLPLIAEHVAQLTHHTTEDVLRRTTLAAQDVYHLRLA